MKMYNAPQIELTQGILNSISHIDEKKGYWQCFQKYVNIEKALSVQDTIQESAEAAKERMDDPKSVDMSGYIMALNWVFTDYRVINVSEKNIDKLYNLIQNKPANSRIEKNISSPTPAQDTSNDDFGSIFGSMSLYEETPAPAEDGKALEDLINWYNTSIKENTLHPIITAGIFAAEFLKFKVYPDANSRLSRLLTILLLLKSGYTYQLFHSLDALIDRNYDKYEIEYKKAFESSMPDYDSWIALFLSLLEKQADVMFMAMSKINANLPVFTQSHEEDECLLCEIADDAPKPVKRKSHKDLPALQCKIMKMFEKQDTITISEVVKKTRANINTVKKHLAAMVCANLIEKHGKTRGCWYTAR